MIRAGLIGLGYWGPNLLRNLAEHDSIEVRAVCDLDSRRLKLAHRKYPSLLTTNDYRELVRSPEIDLIAVATPVQSHFELGKAVLLSGKHLLLTKPMANSSEQCEALIEIASKKNRLLMVDHTFVYHPAVEYLQKMVGTKALGGLLSYQSSRMNLGLYQPDVSVIFDLMPHDLSILNMLVREDPIEICVCSKKLAGFPQADLANVQLNYQSNFFASIQASWISPMKVREIILTGSRQMAVYDDTNVTEKVRVFNKGIDTLGETDIEQSYTKRIQYREGDMFSPNISTREALKNEMDDLVESLLHNRLPKSNGMEGLRVVRVLERADKLANSGKCWSKIYKPINYRDNESIESISAC